MTIFVSFIEHNSQHTTNKYEKMLPKLKFNSSPPLLEDIRFEVCQNS